MSWHVEDWGTTKGTAGTLGWTKSTGGGWKAGEWYWEMTASGTRFGMFPVGVAVTGGFGVTGPADWQSGTGSFTGSQYHYGLAVNQQTGDHDQLMSRIAVYQGTEMYFAGGCYFSGAGSYFQFRTLQRIGTAGTFTVGTVVQIANDGAIQSSLVRFDITHEGGGSWSGTVTNINTGSVGTYSFGLGTNYTPTTLDAPTVGMFCYTSGYHMYTNAFEYNAAVVPESATILRFIGTWASGSGTYEWGADVIGAPSNIQDRAFGPLDSAGWASTVSVTLDDSRGQWGAFAGTGQTPYEGTWQFRRQWNAGEVSGTWVTLLTGFVEPESVQYDYANRTARLTVQSSIARASQKIAIHDGNTFSSRQMSVPCYQGLLGTITYADSSTGTLRVGNVQGGYWQPESRCRLWGTFGTETESVTVGSSITPIGIFGAGGTGTLVVNGEFPGWMAVGNEIWLTRPWPSYSDRNSPASGLAFTYVQALLDRLGLTWPADNQQLFQKQSSSSPISPGFRVYGGEKLTTALTGIMQACNGFFSVSPAGEFRVHCSLPTYSTAGSVDFLTAYDSDWSMGYEASVTGIELDSSFNSETGSYTTHTSVGGTAAWGAVRELKLPWVGSGIEAESLAGRLYRASYIPRPSLTLRFAGSSWATYLPGEVYTVHNLPTHLVSKMAGTQFVLYSKTHDWQDDLTALELVAQPGGNYAVWDGTPADTWHESGKVWY